MQRIQPDPRYVRGTRWRLLQCVTALTLICAALIPALQTRPATAQAPSEFYVNATGHVLAEPYLSYWAKRDGLNAYGLPVSEPLKFRGLQTQFFQLGYLQAKSSDQPTPLTDRPVGRDLLQTRRVDDRVVAGRRVGSERTAAFRIADSDLDHPVEGRIESFYENNDGAERFGAPLSAAYVVFGKRTQWFENGRLQWELPSGKVQAAPVGLELARALDVDTTAIERGEQPLFQAKRFRVFKGDGTIPEAPGRFSPVKIAIPKIKLNANIEQIGIVDGVMGTPTDAWNVGWYPTIAKPGERTNVVMAGHKDWWNIGPVVFWSLDQLKRGDKIYLTAKNGKGATYVVTKSWSVDANTDAGEVINDAGAETLTLITCGGDFNGVEYLLRHIVRAERI